MNLEQLSKFFAYALIVVAWAFLIVCLAGCQKTDYRFVIEKMPADYRACAARVVPEINKPGPITQKELLLYAAKLKRYAHTQNRCLKGAIKWADAQYRAYYQRY